MITHNGCNVRDWGKKNRTDDLLCSVWCGGFRMRPPCFLHALLWPQRLVWHPFCVVVIFSPNALFCICLQGRQYPSIWSLPERKRIFFFFYSERQIHVSSLSGDLLKVLKETAEWNATCVAWIVNRCWKDDAGGSWAGVTLSGRVLGAPVHQCFCSLGI